MKIYNPVLRDVVVQIVIVVAEKAASSKGI